MWNGERYRVNLRPYRVKVASVIGKRLTLKQFSPLLFRFARILHGLGVNQFSDA